MATAAQYDQYEDPGLAFSTEEVEAFDPKAWMTAHVERLAAEVVAWRRRGELPGMDHPWTVGEVVKALNDKLSWDCTTALELPINTVLGVASIHEVPIPDPKTDVGKQLTKRALEIEPRDWLAERLNMLHSDLRYVVTILRRQMALRNASRSNDEHGKTRVKKTERSYYNKFIHCLVRELNSVQSLIDNYDKQPKKKGTVANEDTESEVVSESSTKPGENAVVTP
jgi:hypothetical protein